MTENKDMVACYIRLSEDDEDTAKGIKDESNSVAAQRNLIHAHIDGDKDLRLYKIQDYVDDGYSGTTFKRPAFVRMMDDVKKGEVSVIIVKDFSRFGRDHLETGNYLERIFPLLGIRFISVNDCFDSMNCDGTTGGMNVALKNIMNSMYSRDLSNKVRSAMNTRAKHGQYMASMAAYGYKKDPEDIHHLLIDDEAADTVRKIFHLAAEGKNKGWICGYLNSQKIPTPGEYIHLKKGQKPKAQDDTITPRWAVTTVADILRNQVYIGNTCWNKSEMNLSTGKKMVRNSYDEWTVKEGTHEPIVSRDLFEKANEAAFRGPLHKKKFVPCPLVYCAYCGRTLPAPTDGYHIRYRCRSGYGEFALDDCKKVRIKATDLEKAVLANVNMMAKLYLEESAVKKKIVQSEASTVTDEISMLKQEAAHLGTTKMGLYEDYRRNGNKDEYLEKKSKLDSKLADINAKLTTLQEKVVKTRDEMSPAAEEVIMEMGDIKKFDKMQLKKIINRINVYAPDQIEIIWKPLDPFFQEITSETGRISLE